MSKNTTARDGRALDQRLYALEDVVYAVEDAHGAGVAHRVLDQVIATKAAQSPAEGRIGRAVITLRGLLGDEDVARLLEGLIESTRIEQRAQLAATKAGPDGLGDVLAWLRKWGAS